MNNGSELLYEQIMHLFNALLFLEKKSIFQYKGITLYPSEIHLMEIISQGHAVNATFMAERLGITKGAVSQTISRLEKKKILNKKRDPYHKNELTVIFTPTGKDALDTFNTQRIKSQKRYSDYLNSLSIEEREIIQKFLLQSEQFLSDLR